MSRRPLLPTDTLFFLHLPKCGGTTFNGLLRQMYWRDGDVYKNPYLREELLNTPDDELRRYRLIRGHFQYPDVVNKLGFRPRTVTFLRDPVTRFVSHFRMCKQPRKQPAGKREQAYLARLADVSFEQFLERPELNNNLANLQYRLLAGYRGDEIELHHCDYDQPYDCLLDKMEVVGLLERFDESLDAFCFTFDLPPMKNYPRRNVSSHRSQAGQLSPALCDRVAELNRHDVLLYAEAQRRFERQQREMQAYPDGPPTFEQPQDAVRWDMTCVPPGNDWWPSAGERRRGWARWTGPGCAANLYVTLTPGSKTVRLTVVDAAGRDVLRSLKLLVEGTEVPLRTKFQMRRLPCTYTGQIPGSLIPAGRRTQLTLQVARTRRPSPQAPRAAGICVSSVEISPAGCAAPVAFQAVASV